MPISIEVCPHDLKGTYSWDEALKACKTLGDGWRLPTKEELNLIYRNREDIGGFVTSSYWSSSEIDSDARYAWTQSFSIGTQTSSNKSIDNRVRPVRSRTTK